MEHILQSLLVLKGILKALPYFPLKLYSSLKESGILSKRKHNHLAVGRPFGKPGYNNKGHPMQWIVFQNFCFSCF